jgi:hypothetical protein
VPTPRLERLLPLFIGFGAFLLVVGPRVLYPWNIGWLDHGDPATYYLGWEFFRASEWSWPPGANPRYGLELGSSIVYSDSIPLLALFFKACAAVLPLPFQYFGLWVLACFLLQAWFGWRLCGLATPDPWLRALGTGFFVCAPPMLWRLDDHIGHLPLLGHFLLLAALYLALQDAQPRRGRAWLALLATAALVNAYLLAMVLAVWLADGAARVARAQLAPRAAAAEAALGVVLVAGLLYLAGYFLVGNVQSAGDYGVFRMNLLAPIDPGRPGYAPWSRLLPDLPGDGWHHEGFNYFGLGLLALVIVAAPAAVRVRAALGRHLRARPFLLALVAGLSLYAVTHRVGFGDAVLELPLPDALARLASVFRSSARMFWLPFYALLCVVVFVIVRAHGRRTALALLGAGLVLQLADTSAGWLAIRGFLMAAPRASFATTLQDPFWDEAARRYRTVRLLPPEIDTGTFPALADYAARHGMATDAVYLARIDDRAWQRAEARAVATLGEAGYDADTLYVIRPNIAEFVAARVDRDADLLAVVDGFLVLAPGWKRRPPP